MKRYEDCIHGDSSPCVGCALSAYGKDCRNAPASPLAYHRQLRGLSQGQLAKASGLTPMVISRLERGEAQMAESRLKTVLALADALGITDLRELI